MLLLKSIGLNNKKLEVAEAPYCECGCGNRVVLSGDQFENKEEIINVAISLCEEWHCNHTFAFVKFNDGTCLGAFPDLKNNTKNYEWKFFKFPWANKQAIKDLKMFTLTNEIHFAAVFEENKDGDFMTISQ